MCQCNKKNKIMGVIDISKTMVNEITNTIVVFLIIESAVMIPYIQDIETKQYVYNTSFYDKVFVSLNTQALFINLGSISMCICFLKNIIYLICKRDKGKNLFIRFVVNLLSYGVILFFGHNHNKPYSALDITDLVCILFVCFVSDIFLKSIQERYNTIETK